MCKVWIASHNTIQAMYPFLFILIIIYIHGLIFKIFYHKDTVSVTNIKAYFCNAWEAYHTTPHTKHHLKVILVISPSFGLIIDLLHVDKVIIIFSQSYLGSQLQQQSKLSVYYTRELFISCFNSYLWMYE